jgi:undecaprenyl-diphosphatase
MEAPQRRLGQGLLHCDSVISLADVQVLDERLLAWARGSPPPFVPLFHVITIVGGGWGLLGLVPFLVRRTSRMVTAWLLAAVTAQSALVSMLKALVGRVRPCDALAWCVPIGVGSPGGGSFPSGHAAGAFAFAAFVAVRHHRWAAPALLWAALVAWSRCVLGVHYPSDIIAGALIGSAVGAGLSRASQRWARSGLGGLDHPGHGGHRGAGEPVDEAIGVPVDEEQGPVLGAEEPLGGGVVEEGD